MKENPGRGTSSAGREVTKQLKKREPFVSEVVPFLNSFVPYRVPRPSIRRGFQPLLLSQISIRHQHLIQQFDKVTGLLK